MDVAVPRETGPVVVGDLLDSGGKKKVDAAIAAGLLGTAGEYKRCGVEPTVVEVTEVQATERCEQLGRQWDGFHADGPSPQIRRSSDACHISNGRIRACVCKPAEPSKFAQWDPGGDGLAGRC